jgi:hypothetical protein
MLRKTKKCVAKYCFIAIDSSLDSIMGILPLFEKEEGKSRIWEKRSLRLHHLNGAAFYSTYEGGTTFILSKAVPSHLAFQLHFLLILSRAATRLSSFSCISQSYHLVTPFQLPMAVRSHLRSKHLINLLSDNSGFFENNVVRLFGKRR